MWEEPTCTASGGVKTCMASISGHIWMSIMLLTKQCTPSAKCSCPSLAIGSWSIRHSRPNWKSLPRACIINTFSCTNLAKPLSWQLGPGLANTQLSPLEHKLFSITWPEKNCCHLSIPWDCSSCKEHCLWLLQAPLNPEKSVHNWLNLRPTNHSNTIWSWARWTSIPAYNDVCQPSASGAVISWMHNVLMSVYFCVMPMT